MNMCQVILKFVQMEEISKVAFKPSNLTGNVHALYKVEENGIKEHYVGMTYSTNNK